MLNSAVDTKSDAVTGTCRNSVTPFLSLTSVRYEFINAAHSLKNFLAVSDDKEKLASIIAPNFVRDYWSSFEVIEAKKIWKKL